jgi:hypothetical protein
MDDGIHAYTGRTKFVFQAACALFLGGVGVAGLVEGQPWYGCFMVALGVGAGFDLPRRCLKVELHPRGALVLHKAFRDQQISVRAVQRIEFREDDEGSDDDFLIRYEGGSFVIGAGSNACALVDAIIQGNPRVEVSENYRR